MENWTSGKKFSKIWVYLARLSSFWEILENAVPFTTGSCRKRKPDFWVEWKAPLLPRSCLNTDPSGFEITTHDSEACRSEKYKARQKQVPSRGLQCLGFSLVRFCFFNLLTSTYEPPTKTITSSSHEVTQSPDMYVLGERERTQLIPR